MTTYEVGQTVAWTFTAKGTTGAPADAGTVAATVTQPDGTSAAGTVTHAGPGVYVVRFLSTQAGRHRCRLTGTGTTSLPHSDVADVWPTDPRLIISMADARDALNLPTTNTVSDDELRLYIAAATPVIEDITGPVLTASTVETFSGGGRLGLALSAIPTAITSVVEDSVTLAASAYCFDEAGILWRGSSPRGGSWSATAPRNVTVTYAVGAGTIAPNVILAAREEVRFLYQRQQAPRPSFGASDGATTYTPSGYAVPNFVVELLAPSVHKVPGFA